METAQITGEATLLAISQIGLGFAGFIGIILTLSFNPDRKWPIVKKYGMLFIFAHSFWVTIAALLPTILILSISDERRVWWWCHLLMAAFLALSCLLNFYRLCKSRHSMPKNKQRWLFLTYLCPTAFLAWVITMGLSFYPEWTGFTLFVGALGWVLFAAGVQFYIFLHIAFQETESPNKVQSG